MTASPTERGSKALDFLRRAGIDLRPGEVTSAFLLFACLFLLLTFQITTKTVRQSTFIDSLGAEMLPLVYLLVAICSYPFLRLYSRLADRMQLKRLIIGTSLTVALTLMGFWALMRTGWPWVSVLFYVMISITFGLVTTQFWSFATHLLDPRQAKRLFGLIGAGGLLGGILGGQVARLTTAWFGTESALIAAALMLVGVAALIWGVQLPTKPAETPAKRKKEEEAKGGWAAIMQSRHLQMVALLVSITVIVAQIVDLQFNWAVEQSTTNLDERTAFFGNFFSVVGILAFVFQIAFTARIHRSLGVGFALRVLPVTLAVGTIAMLLAGGMFPEMLVIAALILKVGENGLRFSLDQSTRELLYLPVPAGARVKAKAFIDVFLQRGAKGLSALMLLPVTLGVMTVVDVGWISLVLIGAWLVLIAVVYREYVRAYRLGLKQKAGDDEEVRIDLADGGTLAVLMQALGSADTRQVLHGLDVLESHGGGHLIPPLLLYHDDADVRRRTLEVLASIRRQDAAPLIERRLGDDDADVRAEAVRVLADLHGQKAYEMMLPKLSESEPSVRAAAVACVAVHGDEEMVLKARGVLADMMTDADPEVRAHAARGLGAIPDPGFQEQLLQSLYDGEPVVCRQAIASVRRRIDRDGFNPMYVPTLTSLLQDRRVKQDAQEALVAFGESAVPALTYFMNDPSERTWVRRALPKTLAQIDADSALEGLLTGLQESDDPFQRRQLITALVHLRRRNPDVVLSREIIEAAIRRRASDYLTDLAIFIGLGGHEKAEIIGPVAEWREDAAPGLLDRLLVERMQGHLADLFGLLALIHPPENIRPALHSLISGQPTLRANALEYLDNSLSGDVRRDVFAVIDDSPIGEKLRQARKEFGTRVQSRSDTLRLVLSGGVDGAEASSHLIVAALYAVRTSSEQGLTSEITALQDEDNDSFVRETAGWVAARMESTGAA